jgi:adenylyltransferase/sulfurtransferase
VLGVLPGIIGVIQATESIKLVTGIGEPLIGRFLIYDALKMRFRELKLKKDPECPVCGPNPTVTKLIDYEQFCGVRAEPQQAQTTGAAVNDWEITSVDLKKKLDAGETPFILDVREPNEYQINRIPGSTLIPLGELPRRYQELPKDREIVTQCKMGGRSAKAQDFLKSVGFTNVKNLKGGILEWIDKVDPSQPKY